MNRLAGVAFGIVVALGSHAAAEEPTAVGPGKTEAGLFLGGFISNYFHQFYDVDAMPNREELGRVSPLFGVRFAAFPSRILGVEGETSLILASTKDTSEAAKIYGLRVQAVLQRPGRLTPFAAAGVGMTYVSSDDSVLGSDADFPIHLGVGARYFATRTVAVRFDARFVRGPSQQDPYTLNASYGELMLGLSFNPKAGRAVEVRAPLDPDPDRDGVLDAADACPTEPGPGTADGCPARDLDGDGLVAPADVCPTEPETANGFNDDDGCPDVVPDADGDGLDDNKDQCRDAPEDADGFQDDDGCPDPDNDGDQVMDGADRCPLATGPVENAGCPDVDTDGDGVVDRLDNCPTLAGTADHQGCTKKQLVVISTQQLKILDQVRFRLNSARLDRRSNALLDNIAAVLAAHPEITKLKIEGHTDDRGPDAKNLELSRARAEAVMAYLVTKGVDPARLEAQGHGETKPLIEGKTRQARTANRRVEFNIPTPSTPPPAPTPTPAPTP